MKKCHLIDLTSYPLIDIYFTVFIFFYSKQWCHNLCGDLEMHHPDTHSKKDLVPQLFADSFQIVTCFRVLLPHSRAHLPGGHIQGSSELRYEVLDILPSTGHSWQAVSTQEPSVTLTSALEGQHPSWTPLARSASQGYWSPKNALYFKFLLSISFWRP